MHGFINSPALAKLVALQMVDEQLQQDKRRLHLRGNHE
jgi:glycine/D-amino acid oxidase-like deaminating enzyme